MDKNDKGITLLEVLVTLVIISIIGTIIWNVFFQGYNYSKASMNKNKLQQEVNLVVVTMKKFHQSSQGPYKIDVSDCNLIIFNQTDTKKFENPNLCYSTSYTGEIDPNDPDTEYKKIKITVADNSNNKSSIETILYRLKSGG